MKLKSENTSERCKSCSGQVIPEIVSTAELDLLKEAEVLWEVPRVVGKFQIFCQAFFNVFYIFLIISEESHFISSLGMMIPNLPRPTHSL